MRNAIVFGLVWLSVAPLLANERQNSSPEAAADSAVRSRYSPDWPAPPDTTGMLLRLGIGTAFTVAACGVTLALVRRHWLKMPLAGGSRRIRVEEFTHLGNRAVLYLVTIGDQRLVAGTDLSGLKSLLLLPTPFGNSLDEQLANPISEHADEVAEAAAPTTTTTRERVVTKPAFPDFSWNGVAAAAIAGTKG